MAWSKTTRIGVMLAIDVVFFFLELITGFMVGSLALTADAFHMLNDIISLAVGMWAVMLARKATTDKFSYGWLRAEILGAFFNAVFLIALCVSIVLEALGRLVSPPEINNPVLILVVGSVGLASNLVGFVVLGGHGHSHGHEHNHGEHDDEPDHNLRHSHNHAAAAEEGRAGDGDRRRSGTGRLASIDDISFYPSSFRQEIIEASRPHYDGHSGMDGGVDENSVEEDEQPTEQTSLLPNGNRANGHKHKRSASHQSRRGSEIHSNHNHVTMKKSDKKSTGGHNHDDMGMNAMILHVLGDALGNVGVIVTALIIWLTDWPGKYYADPATSLFITIIILRSALPLTFAASRILLQATPENIDLNAVRQDIQALPGVVSCHHVHIWQLSDTKVVSSMHIQVAFPISEEGGEKYMALAKMARKCLHAYGIHSATIQPEFCLDETHDHDAGAGLRLDGPVSGFAKCGTKFGGDCLLDCIDECGEQGCCTPAVDLENGHVHDSANGHSHEGHNHAHGDDHSHEHSHPHE